MSGVKPRDQWARTQTLDLILSIVGCSRSTENSAVWLLEARQVEQGSSKAASLMVQVRTDSEGVTVGRCCILKVEPARFVSKLLSQVLLLPTYSSRLQGFLGQRLLLKSLLYSQHLAQGPAHGKGSLLGPLCKGFLSTDSKLNCLNNSSDDNITLAFGVLHCLEIKS